MYLMSYAPAFTRSVALFLSEGPKQFLSFENTAVGTELALLELFRSAVTALYSAQLEKNEQLFNVMCHDMV